MPIETGQTVRVAVFGHYDSRGGTTAVVLKKDEDKQEAIARYAVVFAGGPEEAEEEWATRAANEDFLGVTTLTSHVADSLGEGIDIEGGDHEALHPGYDDPMIVLAAGPGEDDDFCQADPLPALHVVRAKLAWWRQENREWAATLGPCHHPRWDDDAFSFVLVGAD